MRYEYTFYRPGSSEEIATEFTSEEPLPHIQVGHWVTLTTPEYAVETNHRLRIEGVECHLSKNQHGQLGSRIRFDVYLSDEVRTPQ